MKTSEFSTLDNDNNDAMLSMRAEQRSQTAPRRSKRLTDCPACEGIVSRRAHFCPHCGEPDPSRHIQRSQWLSRLIWTAIIAVGCWYAYTDLLPWVMERMK